MDAPDERKDILDSGSPRTASASLTDANAMARFGLNTSPIYSAATMTQAEVQEYIEKAEELRGTADITIGILRILFSPKYRNMSEVNKTKHLLSHLATLEEYVMALPPITLPESNQPTSMNYRSSGK